MITLGYCIFIIEPLGAHIISIFFEQLDFDMLDDTLKDQTKKSRLQQIFDHQPTH